jgi:hypothetical protein
MTRVLSARFLFVAFLLLLACSKTSTDEKKAAGDSTSGPSSTNNEQSETNPYIVPAEDREWDTLTYETLVRQLPEFDLNQDLSTKSLEELRILRNTIPARKGFLFMNADMRYYFYNTKWYKKLMESRWYGDCEYSGLKKLPPISYTPEETAFMDKISKLEVGKKQENYIVRNGLKYANVKNIVNGWQFGGLPAPLLNGLDRNGFAIVPAKNVQLFHLYEQNDYSQTQNFVSTDLYLQLFHMHFSFMLRRIEEEKFVPIVTELTQGMLDESRRLTSNEKDPTIKDDLHYTQAFYAVPLSLITENKISIDGPYKNKVASELNKIEAAQSATSDLLAPFMQAQFSYDMFKPRGHYTRNESLQRYFRTMQWLQLGAYCLEESKNLRWAMTAAFILNYGKTKSGTPLKQLYLSVLEPTTFLIGKPDNVSLLDICEIMKAKNITTLQELLKPETVSVFQTELKKIEASKNVIKPKIENTCRGKVNFMPARFLLDNEVLQEMTDLEERPYPKGLDVMAAFGSQAAEDILVKELKEDKSWSKFLPQLEKMKTKYKNYESWDETVYTKWIDNLNKLLTPDKRYPSFMQLPSWNKKNLNTALASWAELKHDAILYSENPGAAECGGGGECSPPPEPYVLGYVEPNVQYWKGALELLTITNDLLNKYDLMDDKSKYNQEELKELCTFLLTVSEKELRGEKLLEQEYNTIESIGSSVEYTTLSIMGTWSWDYVSGPDKEIAVVADIYTNNQENQPGILHAAVGYANDLYVVVEIDGYLYVTKGSTFSYYEHRVPLNNRMTDEEWQEMLKKGKSFPLPAWMEEIIIKLDNELQPKVVEYLYSSGC